MHADAVQAHAETYIGLVECGVGLVPGWGGCGEYIDRWVKSGALPNGPMPAVAKAFETISTATVSKSAAGARELMFLRKDDAITMNRDRLLADAKAKALALVDGYRPPKPPEFRLPGESGRVALGMAAEGFRKRGLATDYDMVVSDALAGVLTGGEADLVDVVSEEEMLALERAAFMARVHDSGPWRGSRRCSRPASRCGTEPILPGTGRGTMRSMVEGEGGLRDASPLHRFAVPLPVPGRN
jgi:3-hydroxyacyl-CoA dehydrogenase